MSEYLIKRGALKEIEAHLSQKEISLITGARQVGKTTLMKVLQSDLEKKGKKTVYLSLDFERDRPFFESQMSLLKKIELEAGKEKGVVFIDEIQRKENAGLFLKGLYDMDLPYKFVVSGSGSLELKENVHESLAGRKRIFEIYPVSFEEFVNFKTQYKYEGKLKEYFEVDVVGALSFLSEYLSFGGYPRIILEEKMDEKTKIMDEILNSYLERDIQILLKINKAEAFISLMKLIASQTGNIINYSEISNTLGISVITVKQYLWYAAKTFTLKKCVPFFKNKRKEIVKSPKIYFTDPGFRNFLLGYFGQIFSDSEKGSLFENFVFMLLRQKFHLQTETIHFWRTKDGAEIDFVIALADKIMPFEVKYKDFKEVLPLSRGSRHFIEKYRPEIFYVVNKSFRGEARIEKTTVHFIPFWELIFGSF